MSQESTVVEKLAGVPTVTRDHFRSRVTIILAGGIQRLIRLIKITVG